jgi:hypothetical protein
MGEPPGGWARMRAAFLGLKCYQSNAHDAMVLVPQAASPEKLEEPCSILSVHE